MNTQPSLRIGEPRKYITDPAAWPYGTLKPEAPCYINTFQIFTQNVEDVMKSKKVSTLSAMQRETGIDRKGLDRFLKGETMLSAAAIAALEKWAGQTLWPGFLG